MKLCYNCANLIESDEYTCPFCGADTVEAGRPVKDDQLTPGTELKGGRYIVGRAVSSYRYGVVYAAFDTLAMERAAITEYFPEGIAARVPGKPKVLVKRKRGSEDAFMSDLKLFADRSAKLAASGPAENGDTVTECFYENNTAYTVSKPLRIPAKKGSGRLIAAILCGLIVLCALFGALMLAGVIGSPFSSEDEPETTEENLVEAPSLIGLTEEQARAAYPDWELVLAGTVQSAELPAGAIAEQEPKGGAPVLPGSSISITVNVGSPEEGTMPFVRGMSIDEACEALAGYSLIEEYDYDSSLARDCVISSVPEFGEPVEAGGEVKLRVSLGGLLEGIELDSTEKSVSLTSSNMVFGLNYSLIPANTDPASVKLEWLAAGGGVSVANGVVTVTAPGSSTVTVIASMTNEKTGETVMVTDSCRLSVIGGASATAAATQKAATPKPATPKPSAQATSTPKPTAAPRPTATPRPATPKPTAKPTATPAPTAALTAIPGPPTPKPTPLPTPQPRPTETPKPTNPFTPVIPTDEPGKPTDEPGPTEPPTGDKH